MLRWLAAAVALVAAGAANAQLVDRIDVERTDSQSEIRIRFVTTVQYVRHFPQRQGRLLSIALRVTRPPEIEGRTVLEQRRFPATQALPAFVVTFPQEDGTLGVQFDRVVRFSVLPGPDPRTIYIHVPVPPEVLAAEAAAARKAAPAPAPPTAAPAEVEAQAAALYGAATAALKRGETASAVETLNRLLNLPPNRQSQAAQELIGEARERNGEPEKARPEYELYLRLYPQGPGAERVRKRLAALPTPQTALPGRAPRRPEKTEVLHSGGFSQFYYRGATRFDATLVPPQPGLQLDRVTLTAVDQSSLVNSLDLTTRIRAPGYDGKLVIRDVYTNNRLQDQNDVNRLYALYYEHQTADGAWLARGGRQPGNTAGLLGRFDGLWAGYRFVPGLRLNAVAGTPVEFFPVPRKQVYGTSLDVLPDAPGWSANLFLVEQRVDGVTDRRATGSELRYFDEKRSAFLLYDYDLDFRATNAVMLQANVVTPAGTNYTVLLDHRRVPLLQLSNVLPGETATIPGNSAPTVGDLLAAGASVASLRQGALALTPISDLFLVGFTHPVRPKLQLGADFRMSQVSGTGASGNLPETPSTGKVYVYSGQAIRTGLLTANDTAALNVSLIDGYTYHGWSAALSHVYLKDRWRTETALRYYRQTNDTDVRLARFTPSLRAVYRWRDHFSLEAEVGQEITTNDGPLQSDRTLRRYFSLGYRWDFF